METITDATAATFTAEALQTEAAVVLGDFWAPWCAPCRALTPALEALAGERDDLKLVKVNTDEDQSLAASYGVMGLPTVVILRDGRQVGTITQAAPNAARGADRRRDHGVGGRRRDASRADAARRDVVRGGVEAKRPIPRPRGGAIPSNAASTSRSRSMSPRIPTAAPS